MRDFEVCKKAALSGDVQAQFDLRSEERRVGKECYS